MSLMYVYTYFLTTILCTCIALVIRLHATYEMGSEQQVKSFRHFIAFYIMFVVSNGVCLWCNYFRLIFPGYFFSTVNLLALFLAAFFWFLYVEQKLGTRLTNDRAEMLIFGIPAILCVSLIATSPLTHLVFYYSPEGVYQQGELYFIMFATGFFYLLLASGRTVHSLINAKTASQKKEYRYLASFLIFPIIAGAIDFFIPHLPIMELTLILAIVMIYLTLQQSQVYTDALTGLSNRRATDEYLLEQFEHLSEENPLYVFVADVDNFKRVNDRCGHVEGDRALQAIAREFRAFADAHRCHAARWGGDEFVILATNQNIDSPEETLRDIKARIAALNQRKEFSFALSLSIGYATCTDPSTPIAEVLSEADKNMFAQKKTA